MKADKTHISLETAKLLKDCDVESREFYETRIMHSKIEIVLKKDKSKYRDYNHYPAYTWSEILWEYADKFFGEDITLVQSMRIIDLLQQKKYEEADKYFRENCILIKSK